MIEVLEWIFQDFIHFFGVLLLLEALGGTVRYVKK